jgi:esterase
LVDREDGVSIYYEDLAVKGKGATKTLFFIYGLGCSISHWKYQMRYFLEQQKLGEKIRIVWSDFRGHGLSVGGDSDDISVQKIADDIAEVCQHLNITSAIFLGQSMGGTIALKLAELYPELVDQLILQGSPPVAPSKTIEAGIVGAELWKMMIRVNELSPQSIRLLYSVLPNLSIPIAQVIRFSGFNSTLVSDDDVKEYTQALLAGNPNVFWRLAGDMEGFDIAKFKHPVVAPTLIIAGEQDHCVPEDQIDYLSEHLPHSVVEMIPHGSHCPHLDDPDLVNQLISRFINKS